MKFRLELQGLIPPTAAICAASAGLLALAGLTAWWLGQWRLVALGHEYVPMAPSTAVLMLGLSFAAFLRARSSPHPAARTLETISAGLVLTNGIFFGLQFLFGFAWPIEFWLSRTSATVSGIPLGRMSPLTTGCFVLAAAALLCGRWQALRSLGGWLGLTVLLGSGGVVAGYLAGEPFLYTGSTIPMALLTAVAFALVSASTLLGAGADTWPLNMFLRKPTDSTVAGPQQGEWALLLLFLVLGILGSWPRLGRSCRRCCSPLPSGPG